MAEVPQDTARAIINLLVTDTLHRNPNIQFLFAHAGGTLPMLAGRIAHYVPIGDTVDGMRSLGFSPEELDAIGRNNALRLLPTLCCA
jgi:predicted TIM-barrel fold metal-dependent hydrolase